MNHQPYTLEPLPRKVGNFIKRLDREMQERINIAFAYIVRSPFRHTNPTIIKRLHGRNKERYRYRIGHLRFIYRVDRDTRLIRIVQIDNRGAIYYPRTVMNLLDKLHTQPHTEVQIPEAIDNALITLTCKSAVKAGDSLDTKE